MNKPCITCGEPTDGTRCPACRPTTTHTLSASRRGYDAAWQRLSRQARRLQPFCSDCGATEDLTTDHSREAWERKASGLAIRLDDVDVVCRSCNGRRGRARPTATATDHPEATRVEAARPLGKPHTELRMLLTSEGEA